MVLDLSSPAEKAKDIGNPELAMWEIARYDKLKSFRDGVFLSAWQTLSNYYLPSESDIDETKTEGTSGWSDRIFDSTAIEAARTCTTGQMNWATPMAEPWFTMMPPKFLNQKDSDDGAVWCAICSQIMLDSLSRSNYYSESGLQYKSRSVFGTGHMHIESTRDRLINCTTRKIGTYCIAKDDQGIIDTVYAEFKCSARGAAEKFGYENLTPKIKKSLEQDKGKNMDTEFTFLHVIRPRMVKEREPGKFDGPNKPIASIYISIEDKLCVEVGGYDEMPDSVTRFDQWGTHNVWGYSPAFEVLNTVRQLNYMVRFTDAQVELRANPRVLVPIQTYGEMDLRAGGITPYDPNLPGGGKPEEWATQADIGTTEKSIEMKQQAVARMFYADVFKALSQIKYKMTAWEVSQRLQENLEQLSPMFGRIITEKTAVDIKRIFGLHFRAGMFPRPPRSMYVPDAMGKKLQLVMPEVSYTSRLAIALKQAQNQSIINTFNYVIQAAKEMERPELLDNWDLDSAFRQFSLNNPGMAQFERPMNQVIALRSARAKKAAQDRAMALAEQAATAAGKLGKAPQPLQDAVSQQIPQGQPAQPGLAA